MTDTQLTSLQRLKEAVRLKAEERLGIQKNFSDWSLSDIQDFRVDLEEVCKSSVSEKWFYTHLKNDREKLPRIDVLNLLSAYCGYKNWNEFVQANDLTKVKHSKYQMAWIFLVVFTITGSSLLLLWPESDFVVILAKDAYTQESISNKTLQMHLSNGNPIMIAEKSHDTIVVDGGYYKPKKVYVGGPKDTVVVMLYPDDYALMLNYFSRSTTENWERRREQLLDAIHSEAKIFQSHPQFSGIELLNREEFIYRLTLPINSLKNLEIQDIVYRDEKIFRLRFVQHLEDEE